VVVVVLWLCCGCVVVVLWLCRGCVVVILFRCFLLWIEGPHHHHPQTQMPTSSETWRVCLTLTPLVVFCGLAIAIIVTQHQVSRTGIVDLISEGEGEGEWHPLGGFNFDLVYYALFISFMMSFVCFLSAQGENKIRIDEFDLRNEDDVMDQMPLHPWTTAMLSIDLIIEWIFFGYLYDTNIVFVVLLPMKTLCFFVIAFTQKYNLSFNVKTSHFLPALVSLCSISIIPSFFLAQSLMSFLLMSHDSVDYFCWRVTNDGGDGGRLASGLWTFFLLPIGIVVCTSGFHSYFSFRMNVLEDYFRIHGDIQNLNRQHVNIISYDDDDYVGNPRLYLFVMVFAPVMMGCFSLGRVAFVGEFYFYGIYYDQDLFNSFYTTTSACLYLFFIASSLYFFSRVKQNVIKNLSKKPNKTMIFHIICYSIVVIVELFVCEYERWESILLTLLQITSLLLLGVFSFCSPQLPSSRVVYSFSYITSIMILQFLLCTMMWSAGTFACVGEPQKVSFVVVMFGTFMADVIWWGSGQHIFENISHNE